MYDSANAVAVGNKQEMRRRQAAVAIARLNATLHDIPMITHYIAIEALNAQILALKIISGQTGLGPITEFARQLATEINQTVSAVNSQAASLTRAYKSIRQKELLLGHLALASHRCREEKERIAVGNLRQQTERGQGRISRDAARQLAQVRNLLTDLENAANATLVVARNIRIEAAMLQEFKESILSVADILESASQRIRDNIKLCNGIISRIR